MVAGLLLADVRLRHLSTVLRSPIDHGVVKLR